MIFSVERVLVFRQEVQSVRSCMFIDGTDPNNPVYLVLPTGQYIRDTDGNPLVFSGEAIEDHESGYLVDRHGNFLLHNNAYIPSPSVGAEGEKKERNGTLILLAILLVIALVAGGGILAYYLASKDSEASPSPSSSPSVTSTQSIATPEPRDIVEEPSPTQTTPVSGVQLPPEAYPGAGSATVPANAVYNSDLSGGLSVKTPSDNIWCFSYDDSLSCAAPTWDGTQYGFSDNCVDSSYCWPYNTVTISQTGTAQLDVTTNGGADAVLPYGQVAYNGNWVCASEENGMTCWSRASGHGFFLNRSGYKAF